MAKQERKLPDGALMIPFTICDESINRYGWRLLVSGGDLVGFEKNPVCCVQHSTYMIPVGKWSDLKLGAGKFTGTVEFDRNDEDAVKLYWKYIDGYMSAVSLNIIPIEESDDPKYLIPGQTRSTVTKWDLIEISLVTIPGQKNAVKLSTPEGGEYKLNLITNSKMAKEEKTVEQMQAELAASKQLAADNLVMFHKERGVVQDGEIASLKKLALTDYDTVSTMLGARTKPDVIDKNETAEDKADALVALHFNRGAITDGQKKIYRLSAIADYEGTRKELEALKGRDGLETFVAGIGKQHGENAGNERSKWTYLDYYKKDQEALSIMEKNEPGKYKLLEAEFLKESKGLGICTVSE
ncbi:MAG: hypothetical protein PHH37_08355 [Paludibacter sp.]|nr:hypothetical protein [Paludibacter sp.]